MTIGRKILLQTRKAGHSGGAIAAIPAGAIALWSGTLGTIPANWSLCDGSGGTPNLVARFLRGAPAATEPGTTGGADSHTHASMTAAGGHTHTAGSLDHSHTVNSAGLHSHIGGGSLDQDNTAGLSVFMFDEYAGAHQHTNNTASHSHTMSTP
ncbi:unnamed protein product, partial [marine sediment metagenome]